MKAAVLLVVFGIFASVPMAASPANKADLIAEISDETDMDREVVQKIVDSFLENMTRRLAEGDDVLLFGFGGFAVKERAAKTGRNPQTGETIVIPASRVVRFRASETLREAVNKEAGPEDRSPN
jgi:DNA-binding protein HU-beta